MEKEYQACAQHVGIIDISSFSKIEIKPGIQSDAAGSGGNAVLSYLQYMCANDVNIAVGHIVHTGMLNERGGYENDCMLIRQTEESYFMISPSSQQTRIYEWMSRNLPTDASVQLNDVTSMYTVINVVGPKSTLLMSELSNSDVRLAPFSYRKLNIGYASDVMIMSFTHTGMPGYCLYVPSEYALHVYDRLITRGRDYGARDVGTLTQRLLRIDKFIPFWGDELTSMTTPFEAGVFYSVRLDVSTARMCVSVCMMCVCGVWVWFLCSGRFTDFPIEEKGKLYRPTSAGAPEAGRFAEAAGAVPRGGHRHRQGRVAVGW